MKRSKTLRTITIGLATVSAFALAGCKEEQTNVMTFDDLESCGTAALNVSNGISYEDCRKAYFDAEAQHKESAPRYDAMALCEEQHGKDACVVEQRSDGSSVFLPLFMGYMIGKSLNKDDRDRSSSAFVYASPLYRSATGGYTNINGSTYFASNNGIKTSTGISSFSRAPSTITAAPMSRTTISSRGGFGGSRGVSFGG